VIKAFSSLESSGLRPCGKAREKALSHTLRSPGDRASSVVGGRIPRRKTSEQSKKQEFCPTLIVAKEVFMSTNTTQLIKVASLLFSIFLGFIFNFYVASEWAALLGIESSIIAALLFWAVASVIIYMLIQLAFFRKINRIEIRCLSVFYLLAVIGGLFLRSANCRVTSINPIGFIFDFLYYPPSLYISIINLALFVPLKPILYLNKWNPNIVWILLGQLSIEFLQYVSGRGIADVSDIVLYLAGYYLGVLILNFVCGRKRSEKN
jgi:glycopeptide antibiotics resistance protein